ASKAFAVRGARPGWRHEVTVDASRVFGGERRFERRGIAASAEKKVGRARAWNGRRDGLHRRAPAHVVVRGRSDGGHCTRHAVRDGEAKCVDARASTAT